MKKQFKRSICILLAMLLMANMLTACSSAKTEKETQQETQQAEVTEEEVVEEPTPEPTPEPISYEGIDMESTLPGKEWMYTFKGIIEEPKFVVFNDETNKKVIVEDGDKVEFEESDTLAIFTPGKILLHYDKGKNVKETSGYNDYYNEVVFSEEGATIPNDIVYSIFNYNGEKLGEICCRLVSSK